MPQTDPILRIEQRLAELERKAAKPRMTPRHRLLRPFVVLALAVAVAFPAGIVLASHQFSDVATSSSIHDDVEAIANAGVTTGCGDGKYCPNANVTRGQMAQFMNRLGALDGQAPVVHADRVDGRHANAIVRVGEMETFATTAVPVGFAQYGANLAISAPTAGFVLVDSAVTIQNASCTVDCRVSFRIRHVQSGTYTIQAMVNPESGDFATASTTGIFPVSSGSNTFQLQMGRLGTGNGSVNGWFGNLTAMFVPFGSTGGTTLGLVTDQGELRAAKEEELLPR
jgi:hypothetical protein